MSEKEIMPIYGGKNQIRSGLRCCESCHEGALSSPHERMRDYIKKIND